jgi:hypothetical protein
VDARPIGDEPHHQLVHRLDHRNDRRMEAGEMARHNLAQFIDDIDGFACLLYRFNLVILSGIRKGIISRLYEPQHGVSVRLELGIHQSGDV